jgi:hypothetical protein
VFLALGSLLLLSWPGTSLTHSVKPSSWHSGCWCFAVFRLTSCLSTTAPKENSWWLWMSSPSWTLQHFSAASLCPSAV